MLYSSALFWTKFRVREKLSFVKIRESYPTLTSPDTEEPLFFADITNVDSMLGQRRRRWANIKSTLVMSTKLYGSSV